MREGRVLSRNSPATPTFNSTATADRPQTEAIRFEEIRLPTAPGLLRNGTNILAIHALNDAADSPNFLMLPELLGQRTSTDRYLTSPTPGAANGAGVIDFVADTRFSVDRGLFNAAERREIVSALAACDGNQTKAAKRLGLSRRALIYKMRKYGL